MRSFPRRRDSFEAHPFHTDQAVTSFEHTRLFEWHGAALSLASYQATTENQFQSKHVNDVILILLDGVVHTHEGEADGRGFRAGSARPNQVSVFPLATHVEFSVEMSRIRNCELYFPARFAVDELGFPDERPLTLQLAVREPFLFAAANQFVALRHCSDDISVMRKDGLFRALAVHVFANFREGTKALPPQLGGRFTPQRIRQLQRYIEDNLHQRISRDELARLSGFELREFSAAFRTAFGRTPAQYIIERRLDRATQLIRSTTIDLADIALNTGFSSQSHLTTTLKLRRGVTPQQLRRSQRWFVLAPAEAVVSQLRGR